MRRRSRIQRNNQVFVSNQAPQFQIQLSHARRFAQAILKLLRFKKVVLSLTFVTDRVMSNLNQQFLNHSYVTDVLAFPVSQKLKVNRLQKSQRETQNQFLGEVVIAPNQAKVRSKEYEVSFSDELSRYICHGILHLAGFRDKTVAQTKKMRQKEDFLLTQLLKDRLGIISHGN